MKKLTLILCFLAIAAVGFAQETKPITLPGKGKINVEDLNKKIDLNMDISQLSVCELRALRNAFAARQGYLFKNSELRLLFNTTSWYDSLAWDRADNEEERGPVKYTAKETTFINKLKAREDQLLKNNFKAAGGIVNLDNLANPFQLDVFPNEMRNHLIKYGFGIVEADHEQIFQVYEKNDYCMFPNFVTTDLYLQLFHLYFDTLLRKVEEGKLCGVIENTCKLLYDDMMKRAKAAKDTPMRDAAEWDAT